MAHATGPHSPEPFKPCNFRNMRLLCEASIILGNIVIIVFWSRKLIQKAIIIRSYCLLFSWLASKESKLQHPSLPIIQTIIKRKKSEMNKYKNITHIYISYYLAPSLTKFLNIYIRKKTSNTEQKIRQLLIVPTIKPQSVLAVT